MKTRNLGLLAVVCSAAAAVAWLATPPPPTSAPVPKLEAAAAPAVAPQPDLDAPSPSAAAGTPAPDAAATLRARVADPNLAEADRMWAALHLADHPGDERASLTTLAALYRSAPPTRGAEGSVLAGVALVAIGQLAGHARDPDVRRDAVALLAATLREQSSPHLLQSAASAAGATGDAGLLDVLAPLHRHADPEVRYYVAEAAAKLPGGGEAPWLQALWRDDASPRLRVAVLTQLRAHGGLDAAWRDAARAALPQAHAPVLAEALIQVLGPSAAAGDVHARAALLARLSHEASKGAGADAGLLQQIGAHLDAETLAAALRPASVLP
ncbi:MAG: HEAT repeat domain-containing protein [Deltaproteobacteria bacterium]|nr:HEAT repeat domain-containing protein [Deltaproteobacteria bacterium]